MDTTPKQTTEVFSSPQNLQEVRLKANLQHIHLLLENLHEIVYRIHLIPEVSFDYISNGITLITGYTPDDFYENPKLLEQLIHPVDRERLVQFLNPEETQTDPLLLRLTHKDGETVWFEFFSVPILDPQGEVVAIEGIARDATEAQMTRGALGESRALLASIIETAQDAIIVLNSDQIVTLFNSAAEEMFRCQAKDIIGHALDRFIPRHAASWHGKMLQTLTITIQGKQRMGDIRQTTGVRLDGEEFPIEVSFSIFEMQDAKYYTAIVRDISERRRVEEELRYLSTHDTLTGLYNRHYFQEEITRLEQARSYPVSIVIADVDGLKNVNDLNGHLEGDELIKAVAQALRAAFRKEDVVARLGGDEFGMILPSSDAATTEKAVQRIYKRLELANFMRPDVEVGLSIGVATAYYNEPLSETIKRADMNMYRHKSGKYHRRQTFNPR